MMSPPLKMCRRSLIVPHQPKESPLVLFEDIQFRQPIFIYCEGERAPKFPKNVTFNPFFKKK